MTTPTLYRSATLGVCLLETLEELVEAGSISQTLAEAVVLQYDKSFCAAFKTVVPASSNANIRAHLHDYNGCDNVYKFTLTGANVRLGQQNVNADALRVVALNQAITQTQR